MVLLYFMVGDELGIDVYFNWQAIHTQIKTKVSSNKGGQNSSKTSHIGFLWKASKGMENPLNLVQNSVVMTKYPMRFDQKNPGYYEYISQ